MAEVMISAGGTNPETLHRQKSDASDSSGDSDASGGGIQTDIEEGNTSLLTPTTSQSLSFKKKQDDKLERSNSMPFICSLFLCGFLFGVFSVVMISSKPKTPNSFRKISVQLGGSGSIPSKEVKELQKSHCPNDLKTLPNLPVPLRGHDALEVKGLGIFVCGGTSEISNDQGKICYLYNGTEWNTLEQKLNVKRQCAYMAQKDQDTIHIMGGTSSDLFLSCLKSEEVLDLRNVEYGWQLRDLDSELCSMKREVIIEIECPSVNPIEICDQI